MFTFPLQSTSAFKAPCSVNSYSGQFAKYLVKYSTSALSTTPSQFTSPYSTEVDGFTGNVSYPAIPSICLNIINASASSIFLSSLTSAFTLPCGVSGYPSISNKLFCRYSTSALSTILSQFTSPYNTDNIGSNGNFSYPGQFAKCLANIIPSLLFTLPSLSTSAFIHPCSVNSYPGQFAKCLSRYVSSSSLTIPSQFTSPWSNEFRFPSGISAFCIWIGCPIDTNSNSFVPLLSFNFITAVFWYISILLVSCISNNELTKKQYVYVVV